MSLPLTSIKVTFFLYISFKEPNFFIFSFSTKIAPSGMKISKPSVTTPFPTIYFFKMILLLFKEVYINLFIFQLLILKNYLFFIKVLLLEELIKVA